LGSGPCDVFILNPSDVLTMQQLLASIFALPFLYCHVRFKPMSIQ
jgi:hypothetical protein